LTIWQEGVRSALGISGDAIQTNVILGQRDPAGIERYLALDATRSPLWHCFTAIMARSRTARPFAGGDADSPDIARRLRHPAPGKGHGHVTIAPPTAVKEDLYA